MISPFQRRRSSQSAIRCGSWRGLGYPAAAILALALAGCAQMQQQREAKIQAMFANLYRGSYGPLDPHFPIAAEPETDLLHVCSGNANTPGHMVMKALGIDRGLREWLGPMLGELQHSIDPVLHEQGLLHHFQMPNGFDIPTVRLIDQTPQSIDFWFAPTSIATAELQAAADDHCQRHRRRAVYRGVAATCGPANHLPVPFGGGTTMREPYAIAGFDCS